MAVESKDIELGSPCPPFRLPSVAGGVVDRDDFASVPVFGVFFSCNHCPYAKAIEGRLIELEKDYRDRGFRFVVISVNDAVSYPEDSFESMKKRAAERGYAFPYLYNEDQTHGARFGRRLHAGPLRLRQGPPARLSRTPRRLADGSSQGQGRELREAVDALLAEKRATRELRTRRSAARIKWK